MAIEEDPPAGVPEWVVTYGDMMSLLLTFFIMLVSMSKIKEEGTMRALGPARCCGAPLRGLTGQGMIEQPTAGSEVGRREA